MAPRKRIPKDVSTTKKSASKEKVRVPKDWFRLAPWWSLLMIPFFWIAVPYRAFFETHEITNVQPLDPRDELKLRLQVLKYKGRKMWAFLLSLYCFRGSASTCSCRSSSQQPYKLSSAFVAASTSMRGQWWNGSSMWLSTVTLPWECCCIRTNITLPRTELK